MTVRAQSAHAAVALAERIRGNLRGRMVLGELTVDIDAATGVAVHPDHGDDVATLLQRADLATHAAKADRSTVHAFHPGMELQSVRRMRLAADLRRGLDAGELTVHFQPKVGLRDRRVVGVECLLRWDSLVHGPVSPEDFVAAAEYTGELGRLTDLALRAGLREAQEWEQRGRPLAISVNLTLRTLLEADLPARVAGLLAEFQVPAERLTLELTECGLIGADPALPNLLRLRDLGVRLSLDAFGTGLTSVSYLRRLPVQEIKVGRSLVQSIATDPGELGFVRAIVDLSRNFDLTVVAVGVESELTLSLLEEVGCDVGQGFLFSRPLPAERLDAWFSAQAAAEPAPAADEKPPSGEVRWLRAVP